MDAGTLTRPARVEHLEEIAEFVEGHADRCALDPQKKFGLLLAIEEAFVNVCHYAYPDGRGEVELTCHCTANSLVVEVTDRGQPFDVLSLPDPDTKGDIMEREIGGLGVYFIRKMSDEVTYRRQDGCNILRIVARNGQGSGA